MKTLALALGGLATAWLVAPAVSLSSHGTVDQRTRAGWRATAARATPPPAPLVVIPSPRRGQVGTRASA